MFNNIISQISSSISNTSNRRESNLDISEGSESNSQSNTSDTSSNKRRRALRSLEVTPEQDSKRICDEGSESDCNSSDSYSEVRESDPPEMDEQKLAGLMKTLLQESEDRMSYLISTKLKPLEELVTKIGRVECSVNNLQREVGRLQQEIKRNNIIVYGIPEPNNETPADITRAIEGLSNSLKIAKIDIDDAFRLGKHLSGKTRPLLIKLLRYREKQNIFKAATALKGTSISISNDKTKEARIAEAALRRKRIEILKDRPKVNIRIRNHKLYIRDGSHTTTLIYDATTNGIYTANDEENMMNQ
jgi:hypothetical protein